MQTKYLLIVIALLCLAGTASGLQATLNKTVFVKGETIEVSGESNEIVRITGTENGKQVFSRSLAPENGYFTFSKEIDLLDPKGQWEIVVSDSNNSVTQRVTVKPTRQSEFLVLSFLSPTPTKYHRASEFTLSVKVTDSGMPVENAVVYTWGLDGKREGLLNNYDGTYSLGIKVPYDARLGEWEVRVIARARSDEGVIGGENSMILRVEESPISIEVLHPKADEYRVGENIPIMVELRYEGGAPVENARAYATVNFEPVQLKHTGNGIYSGLFYPKTVKDELITISIKAEDSANNSGAKIISLKPADYVSWLMRENAVFYILPLMLLGYILYLSVRELYTYSTHSSLKRRKQEILALKKRLHNDFYKRNIITEENFTRRNTAYNTGLEKIEVALKNFRGK